MPPENRDRFFQGDVPGFDGMMLSLTTDRPTAAGNAGMDIQISQMSKGNRDARSAASAGAMSREQLVLQLSGISGPTYLQAGLRALAQVGDPREDVPPHY